jgi:GMP synthase (glutamine-hydrolysing)
MQHDRIAVIDFGGQYAHLIATKVRRQHVLAEIRQPEDPVEAFEGFAGVILSGSPSLASHGQDADWNKAILDLPVPILGFCFGHQAIAEHYGGAVMHGGREWGPSELHVVREHPLFGGLGPVELVWMSHFDSVTAVGPEFEELGHTTAADGGASHRFAAIGSDSLRRYGFQFHPEVDGTVHGDVMIRNFVIDICGCSPTWDMAAYIDRQVDRIREQVGHGSVFLLASGGVDSTVAAKLFGLALPPDRLRLLHVDNGLMRKDESAGVLRMFAEIGLGDGLEFIDASYEFLAALDGLVEPEEKRAAIGNTFIEVFEQQARRLGIEGHLLGQGTIYPDTIETGGTKRADTIKTHHNRVPIIEQMIAAGRVIEPLADLYKVEVRELGERLGIDHDALWRHPFPGPGLGVRLLCSTGDERAPSVQGELNAIVGGAGLVAQALPVRSVGVKADLRSYEHPVLITGQAAWPQLQAVSKRLLQRVPGINRCLWNLSAVPPRALSARPATMTRARLDLLREADHLVMEGLVRHGLYSGIWQCPTAMVPLVMDDGSELVVMRPVHSTRAMVAEAAELPAALLNELAEGIGALPGVGGVALDLTSKPPGTIEWE